MARARSQMSRAAAWSPLHKDFLEVAVACVVPSGQAQRAGLSHSMVRRRERFERVPVALDRFGEMPPP